MVAVGSPYSVLPKSFPKVFGDASPCLALGWCFARAAIRTGESSDDLKSWLLERLYLLIFRLGSSLRPPLALALRNSAALTSTLYSTVALLIPAGLHGPRPDGSVPASSRRTAQPFDFSEISLFPLRASASRAAFQGIALQTAHALCARNSFKYIAQITSVQALLALRPGALIHFPCAFPRAEPHQKAFGPPPLPGRWPSDPYRPVTGLRNAPFGAVLAGCASVLRSLIHRWTFTALLRERRKARTTWIEQSAFQTFLPPKSLQIRCLTGQAYPKPEKLSSPAPFFGRT
jgi:hypothetical protein